MTGRRLPITPLSMVFIIFAGTLVMVACMVALVATNHFILGHSYKAAIIFVSIAALIYLLCVGIFIYRHYHTVAAWLLVVFYGLVAGYILVLWGVKAPAGILMLAFTIILAGVLLGARCIIPVTVGATALLVVIHFATTLDLITPDTAHLAHDPDFGDVAAYGTLFIVFAVIMWLSRLHLEQALWRALRAEKELQKERQSLATRLEEKTRHLKELQLAEMRQLYRFSELGQSSTVLLHELANHLAVITLDMDVINEQHRDSGVMIHAKESIAYLDQKIHELRRHLKESATPQRFAVAPLFKEVAAHVHHKSERAGVVVALNTGGPVSYIRGDPQKLFQVLTILVTNAIEASAKSSTASKVVVAIDRRGQLLEVSVTDWGVGIPTSQRQQLFKPFTSTKKDGMGIGLFIAKQLIEIHMGGSLRLDPRLDQTTFIMTLPEDKSGV